MVARPCVFQFYAIYESLLGFEIVSLDSLSVLGELDNLLALREVARNLEQVFGNVFDLEVSALVLNREHTVRFASTKALAVLVRCNRGNDSRISLGDKRSRHGGCITEEHFELAINDTRIREVGNLGCNLRGYSSLFGLLLALLAFLAWDTNLFGNACRGVFDLLRHRQAVADNGLVAVRGVNDPLVRNLERTFRSALVQTRFHLGVVDVKTEIRIRILFGSFDLHAGLDILGTTGVNSVGAKRDLDELELTLTEFLVELVLLGESRVNRGVHTDGRHFQRLTGESIANFTFNSTSLFATGHCKGDESSSTNTKFLFHLASFGVKMIKASLLVGRPKLTKN